MNTSTAAATAATPTAPVQDLETRLRSLSRSVAARLTDAFTEALGAAPARAALLVDRLGLDKTLASKLVRGLRAEEPLRALLELPAPQGLGLAADAAARAGASAPAVLAMREEIERLAHLQDEFPGGRSDLLAILSGWLPETRDKEDRQARQAAFRAMSTITGTRYDALYNAYVYAPSATDPDVCDTAWIVARLGLRRLRHGPSIRLTSMRADETGTDVPRRLTLAGQPLDRSPRRLLVPAFCSDPLPGLEVQEATGRFDLVLGPTSPPLDRAADLALGSLSRGLVPRFRTEDRAWDYTMHTATRPARVLIVDLLVHRDLYDGRPPIATAQLGGGTPDLRGPRSEQADQIDLPLEQRTLGNGLSRLGSSEVPRCQELLTHAFGELGWDPELFRVYRVRVPYPAPTVTILLWLELPEGPG
ncbi:MAG: hypothetical protein AAGB93_02540 [Planctomycetota bacterium]